MNIAERIKEYYNTDDFKGVYFEVLAESFANEETEIISRIESLFNTSNYETEKYLSNQKHLDKVECKKVYDFISDNLEAFVCDFSGYYVGSTSLDSISFGEQEEQLEGIHNHKTGKDYDLNYLKKCFADSGYFVNNHNYAYYDLQEGLHIDLLAKSDDNFLNDFLATI